MSSSLSPSPWDSIELSGRELRPFWPLDTSDEDAIEKWFNESIEYCEWFYRGHFQTFLDNLLLYRGSHWLNQDRVNNKFLDRQGVPSRRSPRVVINHLWDFVEQRVSRGTRYRPEVAIYPGRPEQSDRDDAKIAQDVNDFIWYNRSLEQKFAEWLRVVFICGEGYLWTKWNPNIGDLHPDYEKMTAEGRKIPIQDSQGNPIIGKDGEPIFATRSIRVGDVDYQLDAPWHVFDMPCRNRGDIDWSIRWYLEDIEYLKAKYPDKAGEINAGGETSVFAEWNFDIGKAKNQVVVYEMYHRHHEFLEKGRYVKRIKGCILENSELPYSHGKIPYVYLSDIEEPDMNRGMSFFQQLFPLQHQLNACASLIYKSLVLFAHPKIVYNNGTVELNQLVNESTLVGVDDAAAFQPYLMHNPIVPQELFQHLEKLERTMEKLSGVFSMSRGGAPDGVRAAKALRVLEEQEDKRSYYFGIKVQNALVELSKMTLSIAGDFYEDSDGRLLRIVGKNNEYKMKQFKSASLSKPFEIRIKPTTSLSRSPSAKIEEINEAANIKFDPNSVFTKGQYLELTGMADSESFETAETAAFKCASGENEDIRAGIQISSPTETEDLITHWKTHIQLSQSREWKELTPPERKAIYNQHLLETEFLMYEKAYGVIAPATGMPLIQPNPVFQQQLMALAQWPCFFRLPVGTGMMTGQPMMGGGALNGPGGSPVPPSGGSDTMSEPPPVNP